VPAAHVDLQRGGDLCQLLGQARLADAMIAADDHQSAAPAERVVQCRHQNSKIRRPAEEPCGRRRRARCDVGLCLGRPRLEATRGGAQLGANLRGEAIAVAGEGADHRRDVVAVADRLAGSGDAGMYRRVGDRLAGALEGRAPARP